MSSRWGLGWPMSGGYSVGIVKTLHVLLVEGKGQSQKDHDVITKIKWASVH